MLAGELMDRRHLEYFLAIADSGSFTRAAAMLNVAQPSLSHAIGALERELGATLFERHGRGVRLTPAGDALLGPARGTLRSFARAVGAVRGVTEVGFGHLRVIANTMWALDPLVRLLGEFRQLRPAVRVSVADPASRSVVLDALRSDEADVGLVDGTPPGGALHSVLLVEQELVAVMPPGSRVGVDAVEVADLVSSGMISTPPGTSLHSLTVEQLEAGGHPAEVRVETAHFAAVVPLVLAGVGCAVLPRGLADEAGLRGATVLPLRSPAHTVQVHLVWRPDRLHEVSGAFVQLATELVDRQR